MTLASAKATIAAYRIDAQFSGVEWSKLISGVVPLADLASLSQARRNDLFMRNVRADTRLRLTVLYAGPDEATARAYAALHVGDCNDPTVPTTGRVECIDTGEQFDNASQAAKHYDLAPSSLYNHLNGKKSFRSVGGKRFRRI